MTLASDLRRRERNSRDTGPLTYMIAETMIPPGELDVTKFRGYGLGDRDPATLPVRKSNSETSSANWQALRKWVQSANSKGVKY